METKKLIKLPCPKTPELHKDSSNKACVAVLHKLDGVEYLEIALFRLKYTVNKNSYVLTDRFFFQNKEWFRYNLDNRKILRDTNLYSVMAYPYGYLCSSDYLILNEEIIKRYFKHVKWWGDAIDVVSYIQREQIDARVEQREENRRDRINKVFSKFYLRNLTGAEKTWITRELCMKESLIFFHKTKILDDPICDTWYSTYFGFCTACNNEVELADPRHLEKMNCPHCGVKGLLISNRSKKIRSVTMNVAFPQKIRYSLGLRFFHATLYFGSDVRKPSLDITEYARILYEEKKVQFFNKETRVFNTWYQRQDWSQQVKMPGNCTDFLLHPSIKQKIHGTFLERYPVLSILENGYSSKKHDEKMKACYKAMGFAAILVKAPAVEYLHKLGFDMIVDDLIKEKGKCESGAINLKGRTAKEVLGFDLSFLRKYDVSKIRQKSFRAISFFKENNYNATDMEIELFSQDWHFKDLVHLVEYATVNKIMHYLARQMENTEKIEFFTQDMTFDKSKVAENIFTTYRDYIRDCEKIGTNLHDTRLLFPKDLVQAHRESIQKAGEYETSGKEEEYTKKTKKYKKFTFSANGLMVVPTKRPCELVIEGRILKHCVGGYVDKVIKEYSMIFFVRRVEAPDIPFYTLELRPKTLELVQLHGYMDDRNFAVPKEVKDFVQLWQHEVVEKFGGPKVPAPAIKQAG